MLSKEYKFYLFCRYHMQRIKDKNTVVYSWFQYIQNDLHIKTTIAEQIVIKSRGTDDNCVNRWQNSLSKDFKMSVVLYNHWPWFVWRN